MSGFGTNNTDHLIRSQLWGTQLKDVLEAELMGIKYVDMLSDFPDGDTFNIPSIGQAEVYDYAEGQAIPITVSEHCEIIQEHDLAVASTSHVANTIQDHARVILFGPTPEARESKGWIAGMR